MAQYHPQLLLCRLLVVSMSFVRSATFADLFWDYYLIIIPVKMLHDVMHSGTPFGTLILLAVQLFDLMFGIS